MEKHPDLSVAREQEKNVLIVTLYGEIESCSDQVVSKVKGVHVFISHS